MGFRNEMLQKVKTPTILFKRFQKLSGLKTLSRAKNGVKTE